MELKLDYLPGQTPLDEDEKEGLKIPSITTQTDLNEFEQINIDEANVWTLKQKFNLETILSVKFIKELHKRMLGEVWNWAGEFRKSDKNIGVDKYQIEIELRNLIDDCKYWIENKTFSEDEIAVRFSHRIVKIHLFSNGNGRHSRIIGNIIINHGFGKPVFSWGSVNLTNKGEARTKYLAALKLADENDYKMLIEFARE